MKRLFPTSLALLLVMGSLGHVFAAAFCPRMPGHDCCPTKTASPQHSLQSHQHMHGIAMESMASESMPMDDSDMDGMVMDDAGAPPSSLAGNEVTPLSTSTELVPSNKVELPIDACPHCMSHSGIQNVPVSPAGIPDQSNKDAGSVPSPLSQFIARPAMTLAQIGLPGEHAPPGSRAPRYILLNVFLI